VVVRVSREERLRTEKELEGLIALGDANRRLSFEADLIYVRREVNTAREHKVDLETRKQY